MAKVSFSHYSADGLIAAAIELRLRMTHGIELYHDVIDPYIGRPGDDLAAHIRVQMNRCT